MVHEAGRYEIRVDGHLQPRWATWFDGFTVTTEPDGTTAIRGTVPDQAALHGLLQRIRDLGIRLISVAPLTPLAPPPPPSPAPLTEGELP